MQLLKRRDCRRYYRQRTSPDWGASAIPYEEGCTIRGVQKLLNGTEEAGSAEPEASGAPTLFPLEPSSAAAGPLIGDGPAKLPPRAPARRLSASARAALADLRRELTEARELLEQLARARAQP